MELKDELILCLERRQQFHVRLDNKPLQTCERDGAWMDILPISIDSGDLGKSPVFYRSRMPEYATPWAASNLNEAINKAERLMKEINGK